MTDDDEHTEYLEMLGLLIFGSVLLILPWVCLSLRDDGTYCSRVRKRGFEVCICNTFGCILLIFGLITLFAK